MGYNKRPSTTAAVFDIENPVPAVPTTDEPQFELAEKMPPLNNPKLIDTMRNAVSDVSNTRSVLQSLGTRPDHETVDKARARISEIDANSSGGSEEAIEDYKIYKAVIAMDEMHAAYEKMLNEAEMRLKSIYEEAMARNDELIEVQDKGKNELMEEEFNEDVVGILKEVELGNGAERIDLSGKGLRFFPEAFGGLKSCVVMNLASNHLQTIPDSIAGLENLEELNLSANLLESLPDSIGLLFKLKVLDVSGNKLAILPDSICHCRSLIELDASFNKLTYLPTNIGYEMMNLKRLSIQLNKIRSLPTSIGEMKSLCLLDLHFNELHGIPPSIGRLTNLEILNLGSNFSDLKELPDTIADLTSLRELDLSNNQIHSLPDTFGRLMNLTKLNLDQNPITIPPKEIVAEGVEAVRAFMAERWAQIILEEENKLNSPQARGQAADGSLLTRSTSWLSSVVSNVSGYWSGAGKPNAEDPYLNQQF